MDTQDLTAEQTTYNYEITIIARPGCDEAGISTIVENIVGQDNFVHYENEGEKTLLYPIQGHKRGVYLFYRVKMTNAGVREMHNRLMSNAAVLQYLIVKTGYRVREVQEAFNTAADDRAVTADIYWRILRLAYSHVTGEARSGASEELTQKLKSLERRDPYAAKQIYSCAKRIVEAL